MNYPLSDFSFEKLIEFAEDTCACEAMGENEPGYFSTAKKYCMKRAAELGQENVVRVIFNTYKNSRDGALGKLQLLPDFFVKDSKGADVVNCRRLADHIMKREHILMENDPDDSLPVLWLYRDGVYSRINKYALAGLILGYVRDYRPDVLKSSLANETASFLYSFLPTTDRERLNADENVVNFKNGLLSLDTLTLSPHSPELLSTVQLDFDWSEQDVPTPCFDAFLHDISGGDEEAQTLLLEYMGACLSNVPGYRFKKALFQVGRGNTGKTQLISLTKLMLGQDHSVSVTFADLENNRFASSSLFGKRLAGCSDASLLPPKDVSMFKMLTGGDEIAAEYKGKSRFCFVYKGFLWFCMNKSPDFSGDNGAWVFERMILLPCDNVLPPEKRDKLLLEKMYAEREGIARKALTAFAAAVKRGYEFTVPVGCLKSEIDCRIDNDTVLRWYTECCELRFPEVVPSDRYTTKKVYDHYKRWCFENNEGIPVSSRKFRAVVADMFSSDPAAIVRHTSKGNYYPFTVKAYET